MNSITGLFSSVTPSVYLQGRQREQAGDSDQVREQNGIDEAREQERPQTLSEPQAPDQADDSRDRPPVPRTDRYEPGRKEESCTVNTDKVDAEIRKLKEKKAQLERQIAQAQDRPSELEKLEKELARAEQELKQKDNDTYRRQHSEYHKTTGNGAYGS